MFDIASKTLKTMSDVLSSDEMDCWWNFLSEESHAKKDVESFHKSMTSTAIKALAR
jgi:hypothetical protein